MVESALAATRNKKSFLHAKFQKIAPRRGGKKAVIAVARAMAVAIYHILKNMEPFHDLGPDYYLNLNSEKIKNRNLKSLQKLGFEVTLSPVPS